MTDFRYDGSDRRKFKRIKKQYSLRLQVKGAGAFEQWDIVLIRDISRLGISFLYDKALKEGMLLNLRINFGVEGEVIQCAGKIVRSELITGTKSYDIGVEFISIGEADSDRIDKAAVLWHAAQSQERKKA
jgi:c-di-GMP-binding flagellar brake protein YcgR